MGVVDRAWSPTTSRTTTSPDSVLIRVTETSRPVPASSLTPAASRQTSATTESSAVRVGVVEGVRGAWSPLSPVLLSMMSWCFQGVLLRELTFLRVTPTVVCLFRSSATLRPGTVGVRTLAPADLIQDSMPGESDPTVLVSLFKYVVVI